MRSTYLQICQASNNNKQKKNCSFLFSSNKDVCLKRRKRVHSSCRYSAEELQLRVCVCVCVEEFYKRDGNQEKKVRKPEGQKKKREKGDKSQALETKRTWRKRLRHGSSPTKDDDASHARELRFEIANWCNNDVFFLFFFCSSIQSLSES